MTVTSALEAFKAGDATFAELKEALVGASYGEPTAQAKPATAAGIYDRADERIVGVDAGTWDEVMAAHLHGHMTREQFLELSEAVEGAKSA